VSNDYGRSWNFLHSPADQHQIWSIAFHPEDRDLVLVGVAPFETDINIIRSEDRGATWSVPHVPAPARSIVGATHITDIQFDPRNLSRVWATCELGGLYESRDSGCSWTQKLEKLGDRSFAGDVHSISVEPNGMILATTPEGLWTSNDDAASFRLHQFPPFSDPEPAGAAGGITAYCRGISRKIDDPKTVFVGTGDYTPGKTGAIQRSVDGGASWSAAQLSVPPNSHFYSFATHAADPDLIVAVTFFGYVYVSRDAGESWEKLAREFGEIRGVAWGPGKS
jgi:photosystem II stability/assembly factor-like uncharacterized protein